MLTQYIFIKEYFLLSDIDICDSNISFLQHCTQYINDITIIFQFIHNTNDISDSDTATLPKPIKQHQIDPEEFRKREHEKFRTAAEVNDTNENKESESHTAMVTEQQQTIAANQQEVKNKQDTVENSEQGGLKDRSQTV